MGCGASSAKNGQVAEPQLLAPGPNSSAGGEAAAHAPAPGVAASSPAHRAAAPGADSAQQASYPEACSPNSTAQLSGAATPVLGASCKAAEIEDQLVDVEEDDLVGSLNGESRLLKFEEPSLQARVDQLQSHVQTQNLGKTYNALQMPLPGAEDDEDEDMDALYDLPPDSELNASWRNKIFSYDGTDVPDAVLTEIMTDTRWAKEVQIKSCKVGVDDVKFLDQLVQDRELRALTLARCNLEDDVVVALARCLGSERWKSVHTLGFDGNQMVGDASAEALAQALLTNSTLHELSLWGTGVGNAGTKSLASALKQNTALKNLWLGECEDITDEGARALMEAVSTTSTLNQLALVMTGVSEELQDEIENLVTMRREERAQALGASRAGSGQEAVPAST
eukprot:Tamp_12602.p1 GENE.Tamp_12602~~Tamp_12602.p1  ORF type:complete len:395 (+),score=99.56 Tamp_12602:36-1220(+)